MIVKNTSFSTLPYLNDTTSMVPVFVDCAQSEDVRNSQILDAISLLLPSFLEGERAGTSSAKENCSTRTYDSTEQKEEAADVEVFSKNDCSKNDEAGAIWRKKRATVTPLTGGLSNALFIVSRCGNDIIPQDEKTDVPSVVLVRIHFDGQDDLESMFVDRTRDLITLSHLSRCGQGPKFYGRFENGRVEEFYPNVEPLCWNEMAREPNQSDIAKAMAKIHLQLVPTTNTPDAVIVPKQGEIFDKVDTWFKFLEQILSLPESRLEDARLQDLDPLGRMKKEWLWLKKELSGTANRSALKNITRSGSVDPAYLAKLFAREIVFCHMDCQSLNILKSSDGSGIKLIDFEYAAYNPRAVDIANTFCEYCDMNNLRADFVKQYPTAEQQDSFLRVNVCEVDPKLARFLDLHGWEKFLKELREEVGRHSLISHLSWAVWAVIQSMKSPIDFDFVQYAVQRMEGYYIFRNKLWLF